MYSSAVPGKSVIIEYDAAGVLCVLV